MREEKDALWFELAGVIFGYESDDVFSFLMGELNAHAGYAKINEAIGGFRVKRVNENGELLLKMHV